MIYQGGNQSAPIRKGAPSIAKKPILDASGRRLRRSTVDVEGTVPVTTYPSSPPYGPRNTDEVVPSASTVILYNTTDTTSRKEQTEQQARTRLLERDIISLANTNKKNELRCTACNAMGSLIQNGAADEARQAWKCKVLNKQISRQTTPSFSRNN